MPEFVRRADTDQYDLWELNLAAGENGSYGLDIEKKYGECRVMVNVSGLGTVKPQVKLAPSSNKEVVVNPAYNLVATPGTISKAASPALLITSAIGRLEFVCASISVGVSILVRVQSRGA
jgi:hypothetical protein